jgi:DNA-binding MarR family transcriptional regulator
MRNNTRAIADLFATASLGAPENVVGFVLWRVLHRYLREVDRALAPLDLTHLQFQMLVQAAWLARSGEAVTQAELARFGDIHRMQVSLMIKALEGKGLVARMRSPSDERAKRIEVTAAGLKSLRRALPVVIEVQRRLFGEEGRPGGSLLTALLRLDGSHGAEPIGLNPKDLAPLDAGLGD